MDNDNVFEFKKRTMKAQNYIDSDKGGKEFMVAKLFEHHNLMVDILWNQRKDIDELTRRIERLENMPKGE